jgi:hypothetical protein
MSQNSPNTDRDFTPAELVRIHEANCQIEFATVDEQRFRLALMKFLGRRLGLAELKTATLGPAPGPSEPRRAARPGHLQPS